MFRKSWLIIALLLALSTSLAHAQRPTPATLTVETVVNLGVQAGNITSPRFLALNPREELLYILGDGISSLKTGNSLGVLNTQSGEIIGQSYINSGDNEPLGLQFDAASGQIYALWKERYGEARPILSIIESSSLQVAQNIPDVEAFGVANGQLYAANAGELFSVNLANNSIDQAERVSLSNAATGPMAVDSQNNRLYLARSLDNSTWTIEIFRADTLAPITSYPAESRILNLLPQPTTAQLFYVTDEAGFRILYRLSADGELADLPVELGQNIGLNGLALSPEGNTLYYTNGQYRPFGPDDPSEGPALIGLDTTTVTQRSTTPLLNNAGSIGVDDNNQVYALYPYDHQLYVADPANASVEVVTTLIVLRDALADPESGLLYVTDSANRVRQLDLDTLDPLAEITLQDNGYDFGFKNYAWSGQLSLDPGRNRLYISGLPATILEADTLEPVDTLSPGGQFTPDPTGDKLYLTNCGVTILNADTLSGGVLIAGSGQRPDPLSPNPCAERSTLDAQNQWLYSITANGVAGSNSGSYLVVYDVAQIEPSPVFSDANITISQVEPDPANQRAFNSFIRHSSSRVRSLDMVENSYTDQLLGLWGRLTYSPATDRLYVGDDNLNRILTLEADTLAVLDELPLPEKTGFKLVELDPTTDRLFLVDDYGDMLAATPGERVEVLGALPPQPAAGAVLSLVANADDAVFARIETKEGDYAGNARPYQLSGSNWQDLGQNLPPNRPTQALAVAGQTLFAAQTNFGLSGSLFVSADGGRSWQPAMTGLQDMWVTHLYLDPDFTETGLIFANTSYAGLHLSTDGGQNWQPLFEQDPNALFPTSNNNFAAAFGPKTVLVSQDLDGMRGLYLANRGADRALSRFIQTLDVPASHLALSPDGEVALAYGLSLWRSDSGGQSWQQAGAGLFAQDDLTAKNLFFTEDGTAYLFFTTSNGPAQLFRSTDDGQSWQPWQAPSNADTFTAVTLSATGDLLFGDNQTGVTRMTPANLQWKSPPVPDTRFRLDALATSPDYRSDTTLFAADRQRGLFKTSDGGKRWQLTPFPARQYSAIPFRVMISPNFANDQTLFVATGFSLFRTTDDGDTWESLSLGGSNPSFPAQRVALSPNFGQDGVALAITPQAVYRSGDGGDTWQPVLEADGEASTTDLLTFAGDGRTVYARFGYAHALFRSDDAGLTWQRQPANRDDYYTLLSAAANNQGQLSITLEYDRQLLQTSPQIPPWQSLSEFLPAELTGVNAVTYDAGGELVIGGQYGVFSSADNGQSWAAVSQLALPPEANIIALQAADNALFALTADGAILTTAEGEGWKNISIIKNP